MMGISVFIFFSDGDDRHLEKLEFQLDSPYHGFLRCSNSLNTYMNIGNILIIENIDCIEIIKYFTSKSP